MLRTDFEYLIRNRILICEGALHSEIQRRQKGGVPSLAHLLLDQPETVQAVHRDFSEAGANLLVTGTAEANRAVLQKTRLPDALVQVNQAAFKAAKQAASPNSLVFGGLGPTGALLKPYGALSEEDYQVIYCEQAEILLDAGVDGFILEGFSSLIEAENCVQSLHAMCSLPIIATMTFLEDGCTKFGDTLSDCFKTLAKHGADVVGVQGTLGPIEIDGFLTGLNDYYPLCVRPNAGYPVRIGNTTTYLSSPEYVAECAELFVGHGAVVIGGAAGFSPAHIEQIANSLRGREPERNEPVSATPIITAADGGSDGPEKKLVKRLTKKLGREPVLTVELEPPRGLDIEGVIGLLQRLESYGIDAVNIPENPLARARISSISLAKVIQERTGLDSIAHLTCRDRNLISLQAELLGAHVLGVNTILALTGDPSGIGDYPSATSIFDVNSLGLVEIMSRMNIGKDFGMNDLGSKTRFNIGVSSNPLAADLKAEIKRLEAKISQGANFIQTQPIFDPNQIKPFLKELESFKIPVIFGVMLVRDYRHAKFLNNEYPGIRIPDADVALFQKGDEAEQASLGVDYACRLVRELSDMSGGIYLMPSFGDSERLVCVCERLAGS